MVGKDEVEVFVAPGFEIDLGGGLFDEDDDAEVLLAYFGFVSVHLTLGKRKDQGGEIHHGAFAEDAVEAGDEFGQGLFGDGGHGEMGVMAMCVIRFGG